MAMTPGELAGLVSGGALLVVAVSGLVGLAQARRQARRERQVLGDALAASEAVSAALSEEALYLSAVLSAVDTVVVLLDRDGRVRFVNERFEDVFGIRDADVVGRPRAHLVDALADLFFESNVLRSAFENGAAASSGARASRVSGIVAPDEVELALARPKPRVLLFSQVPVRSGDRRTIGVLALFRDVTAQRAAEEARERLMNELAARATTDALTALANRRAASDALQSEVERAKRYERPFAVALFDLDHFKRINDDFGHEVGDAVLRAFAEVLRTTARSTDLVARWGGEEFMAVLHEADLDAAGAFAERVRAGLRDANPLAAILTDPAAVRAVTCSCGVTVFREGDAPDVIVRRADEALYEAKRRGRDRVERG